MSAELDLRADIGLSAGTSGSGIHAGSAQTKGAGAAAGAAPVNGSSSSGGSRSRPSAGRLRSAQDEMPRHGTTARGAPTRTAHREQRLRTGRRDAAIGRARAAASQPMQSGIVRETTCSRAMCSAALTSTLLPRRSTARRSATTTKYAYGGRSPGKFTSTRLGLAHPEPGFVVGPADGALTCCRDGARSPWRHACRTAPLP